MEKIQKAAFTIDEATAFLNLSKNYVYKLVSKKKIPYYKPMGGRLFFKPSDLEDFLFRNRQSADYEATSNV